MRLSNRRRGRSSSPSSNLLCSQLIVGEGGDCPKEIEDLRRGGQESCGGSWWSYIWESAKGVWRVRRERGR
nr:hypothetical protein Itr_chr08CG19330 [Ipomoea trifida]GLL49913.1 hypothetical protein Itr_chr15CG15630 [Ipomoea trifida]